MEEVLASGRVRLRTLRLVVTPVLHHLRLPSHLVKRENAKRFVGHKRSVSIMYRNVTKQCRSYAPSVSLDYASANTFMWISTATVKETLWLITVPTEPS
jgi:hypothetical protein